MLLYVVMSLGTAAGVIQVLKPKQHRGRLQPALNHKRRK